MGGPSWPRRCPPRWGRMPRCSLPLRSSTPQWPLVVDGSSPPRRSPPYGGQSPHGWRRERCGPCWAGSSPASSRARAVCRCARMTSSCQGTKARQRSPQRRWWWPCLRTWPSSHDGEIITRSRSSRVSHPLTWWSVRRWGSTPRGMLCHQHKKTAGACRPLERGPFEILFEIAPQPGQASPTALPYSSWQRLSSPSDSGAAPSSAWLGAAPAGGGGTWGGTPAPRVQRGRRRGMPGAASGAACKGRLHFLSALWPCQGPTWGRRSRAPGQP